MNTAGSGAGGLVEWARRSRRRAQVAEFLYGGVIAASVLAVASVHATDGQHIALSVAGVALVYWLAHVYVEAVGGRVEHPEHPAHQRLLRVMSDNSPILIGQLPALAVFLFCRLVGVDIQASALVAVISTAVLLTLSGAAAGYLAGARGWALIIETSCAGSMGLLVIGLKFLLH